MAAVKELMILCQVIDNYGDIGVVYRLAKSITDKDSSIKITIVCSNLESFSLMASKIDPSKKIQTFNYKDAKWTVTDWDYPLNQSDVPDTILECFQCGRPDWLESILFSKDNKRIFHIYNIEYLTAEQYADDFHLLKSYTRNSQFVKKMFFMPGFTEKTAGLIIDDQFMDTLKDAKKLPPDPSLFTVTVFSYERDFTQIFNALNRLQQKQREKNPSFTVKVLAAAGKSLPFAKKAWEETGRIVQFEELPFLQQNQWDKLLCTSDLNFIRGEESLARAALAGKPFVWHAYLQDEDYQLVKVDALLDRLESFLSSTELKDTIRQLWDDYNTPNQKLSDSQLDLLLDSTASGTLTKDFQDFSEKLISNGDLATNLLKYIASQPS